MTEFHNVRFPLSLAFGASGGPEFTTQITQLSNGTEHRNASHALPRRRFDAIAGIKSVEQLTELMQFFISRKGRLYAFRFRDPFDYKSCSVDESPNATDQTIGQGDGVQTIFQLIKTYHDGSNSLTRPISKPAQNSVVIALNGALVALSEYSVDGLTGEITFTSPPDASVVISAGFEFDCVVRFDTDQLDMTLEDFGAGQLRSLPLVELPYA